MNGNLCPGLGSNPSFRRLTEGDLLTTTTSSISLMVQQSQNQKSVATMIMITKKILIFKILVVTFTTMWINNIKSLRQLYKDFLFSRIFLVLALVQKGLNSSRIYIKLGPIVT